MNGIKALTFDTGGTVLDWHTGITRALGSFATSTRACARTRELVPQLAHGRPM